MLKFVKKDDILKDFKDVIKKHSYAIDFTVEETQQIFENILDFQINLKKDLVLKKNNQKKAWKQSSPWTFVGTKKYCGIINLCRDQLEKRIQQKNEQKKKLQQKQQEKESEQKKEDAIQKAMEVSAKPKVPDLRSFVKDQNLPIPTPYLLSRAQLIDEILQELQKRDNHEAEAEINDEESIDENSVSDGFDNDEDNDNDVFELVNNYEKDEKDDDDDDDVNDNDNDIDNHYNDNDN